MKYFLIIFFIYSSTQSFAQNTYNRYLNDKTYKKLSNSCKQKLAKDDTVSCLFKGNSFTVYKTVFSDNYTSYGIKIFKTFPDDSKKEIFRFVERELLRNLLLSQKEKTDRINIKKIRIVNKQGYAVTSSYAQQVVLNYSGYSIKKENQKFKIKLLSKDNKELKISFPAKYNVVKERDKVALQELLVKELSNKNKVINIPFKACNNCDLTKLNDIYVKEGAHFGIEDMNSNIYYNHNSGIVFDTIHINESFSNLFLTDFSKDKEILIDLTLNNYNKVESLKLNLAQFLSHFDKNYYKFFGVEEITDKTIRGTLILYNRNLSYMHLLDIVTEKNNLTHNIKIKMHTYIPTDNIKELFGLMKNK